MAGGKSGAKFRRKLLKSRGINRPAAKTEKGPRSLQGGVGQNKTLAMLAIEAYWDTPLEVLLLNGSNRELGGLIGISKSTVSKWRKRLGITGES